MSNCNQCGGTLSDPLSLDSAVASTCSCATPLVSTSTPTTGITGCSVTSVTINGTYQGCGDAVFTIEEYSDAKARLALSAVVPILYNNTTGVISHQASGVTAGTYGSSTEYPIITVNSTGHITSITLQTVNASPLGPDLTAIEALTGVGYLIRTATNTWALRSLSGTSGRITIANPAGTAGASVIDLAVSGVTAGTYGSTTTYPIFTVDAYGRITTASSQSFPSVTIPAHTHALGDLSNVSATAGTTSTPSTATVGQALCWNGSVWIPTTLSDTSNYDVSALTVSGTWGIAKCANTIDIGELGTTVNYIYKLTDSNSKSVVFINSVVYIRLSDLPSTSVVDFQIGTVASGYEPIDDVVLPVGMYLNAAIYQSNGGSAFSGTQYVRAEHTVRIKPDGTVYINYDKGAMSPATLASVDYMIVPIISSYLTKTIALE